MSVVAAISWWLVQECAIFILDFVIFRNFVASFFILVSRQENFILLECLKMRW